MRIIVNIFVSMGMGKQVTIKVKENIKELIRLKNKAKNLTVRKRLNGLIETHKKGDFTRKELSQYLGISKRTLELWLTIYKTEGIEGILAVKPRRKGSVLINKEVHDALKERVMSRTNNFLSYKEAQQWVLSEHGVEMSYTGLRDYLIRHFKTKIKSPRKSHVKKDVGAIALFKKPTSSIQTYC